MLTPAQLTVLRNAKAGHVYRSEHGHDLYACYDYAQMGRGSQVRRKRVTAIVDRLSALGLLRIGDPAGMQRPWLVTEAGEQLLAKEIVS